jgi:hypothetical protein
MRIHVAVERHHRRGRGRRAGHGSQRRRVRCARARADLQHHLAKTGEIGQQFGDARQVMFAHLIDDKGIGRIQHEAVGALVGLQRLQPGVDIFRRKFRLQTFKTTGPGIHQK